MTDTNEWYTPSHIIEAARRTMGSIDMDPASCMVANEVVKAECFYDKNDDGLKWEWFGNVWLNPPYGRGECIKWVNNLMLQGNKTGRYNRDNIKQAVLLVNAGTTTKWFHLALENANAMCILNKRLNFWHPDKKSGGNRYDQIVFYFGHTWRVQLFEAEFGEFGKVVRL